MSLPTLTTQIVVAGPGVPSARSGATCTSSAPPIAASSSAAQPVIILSVQLGGRRHRPHMYRALVLQASTLGLRLPRWKYLRQGFRDRHNAGDYSLGLLSVKVTLAITLDTEHPSYRILEPEDNYLFHRRRRSAPEGRGPVCADSLGPCRPDSLVRFVSRRSDSARCRCQ